jgi:hypothetical protein
MPGIPENKSSEAKEKPSLNKLSTPIIAIPSPPSSGGKGAEHFGKGRNFRCGHRWRHIGRRKMLRDGKIWDPNKICELFTQMCRWCGTYRIHFIAATMGNGKSGIFHKCIYLKSTENWESVDVDLSKLSDCPPKKLPVNLQNASPRTLIPPFYLICVLIVLFVAL